MKKSVIFLIATTLCLSGCKFSDLFKKNKQKDNEQQVPIDEGSQMAEGGTNFSPAVTEKTLSKEVYVNKTLGGLLGQFAGFLSGYEFARWNNMTGLDESWFEFCNGPYAGNYAHFTPPDTYRYDRLKDDPVTGLSAVWSDDDYHIDILSQYILKEMGHSSYAIKETWKKYVVSDWGGGSDAMALINSKNLLSPFTGSIEAGNRYGWCTEAYIENETLGMNAPGMPNVATFLTDKFACNVGYFDSVTWAKFYAAMYSLAYFETDVKVIMDKAVKAMPVNSYPYKIYQYALEIYDKYPNNYKAGAQEMETYRRNLYRIDNVQTDPNINGGLAILSWLYGENDYMKTAKYSSIMGYDGDCTAAICCGFMGVLKGFKPENEEYATINDKIYHNGAGVYHNDVETTYQARILSNLYPTDQPIDEIVAMYQENFETILLENGGKINDTSYVVPTTDLVESHAALFDNYDAENRETTGFSSKNGTLYCLTETENENSHTGFAYFKFINTSSGETYHTYKLTKGKTYRLTTYAKTSTDTLVYMFARSNGEVTEETSFANISSIIGKSFVFTAKEDIVDVGFMFKGGSADEYVIFDDFMLEEINTPVLSVASSQELTLANGKYIKSLEKPASVKAGEEVLISVEYRHYGGSPLFATLNRGSDVYGGFIFSNTSKNATAGRAVVEIPYVFAGDLDTIQFVFTGTKLYIGKIEIKSVGQYMFR